MICSYCDSADVVTDGEVICRSCGTVLGPEYRLEDFQLPAHLCYGPPVFMVASPDYFQNWRLNNINRMVFYARGATRNQNYRILKKVCTRLQIPPFIMKRAWSLYLKYEGKVKNHVVLGCVALLYQLRKSRYAIRPKNVLSAYTGHRVSMKTVNRMAIDLGINFVKAGIPRAEDYIIAIVESAAQNIGQAYGISNYESCLLRISRYILEQIPPNKRHISPYNMAVCTVYISDRAIARYCKKKQLLTYESLTRITNITKYTLRHHLSRRGMRFATYERENREALWQVLKCVLADSEAARSIDGNYQIREVEK